MVRINLNQDSRKTSQSYKAVRFSKFYRFVQVRNLWWIVFIRWIRFICVKKRLTFTAMVTVNDNQLWSRWITSQIIWVRSPETSNFSGIGPFKTFSFVYEYSESDHLRFSAVSLFRTSFKSVVYSRKQPNFVKLSYVTSYLSSVQKFYQLVWI